MAARFTSLAITVLAVGLSAALAAQTRTRHASLFPPEDLGMLEGPDRDAWQRPDLVMDTLGIADGAAVADVGAGGGWFTIRLAKRVGPNGLVYAEDIQRQMIDSIERRVQREGLRNVLTMLGTPDDPRLPEGRLDAVLIVDTFVEIESHLPLLTNVRLALKPGGRLGVVDFKLDGLGPGPPLDERVAPSEVIALAERAGLRLLSQETFLPYHFMLVFGRADVAPRS